MKKFLSAFLAVLMVLSMVATSMVTVFAADAEEVHSILVTNGEDLAENQSSGNGWRNHKINLTIEEVAGQKAAVCKVVGAQVLTNVRFHYGSATTVDTTKFTHVEFDLYVEDAAKLPEGYILNVELSSAGEQDKDEAAKTINNPGLKTGWNHIKLALSEVNEATGNFNAAAWNFVRVFFSTGNFVQGETDELVLAIDNFGFSDGTETPAEKLPTPVVTPTEKGIKEILVSNNAAEAFYDATKPGWGVGGGGQEYGNGWEEMTIDGKTGVLTALTGKGKIFDSRFHYYAAEPTDISGMTHLEMDIYIPNAAAFNGKQFIIELNDKGLWGHLATGEIRYLVNNPTFVDGWNHLKLSLDSDFVAWGNTPALDKTIWQHIRVWFPDATTPTYDVAAGETLYYGVGNLKFTNADYDAQSVTVPLLTGSKAPGWGLNPDLGIKKAGSSSVAINLAANKKYDGGGDAFVAGFEFNKAGKDPIDTTGAATFRFFVYTNDAAVMNNVGVELELTSSGTCDNQESAYCGTLAKFVEGGSFKNGWNEVIIPMTNFGNGADWTKINFMRMFNQHGAFTTGAEKFVIRLDEFGFYKEDGTLLATVSNCDVESDWEGPTNPTVLDGETVIGNTWEAGTTLGVGWFMFRYGLNFEGKYPAPADISGMKYIEFDFYVSDAMALINAGFDFELTSAGIQDKNESACSWTGPWKNGLDDGWNHMQMPLSWFAGDCDFTAWNFLRLFNNKDIVVGENGLTVAMKNVKFTTGKYYALELDEYGQPLTEKEVITFTPAKGDKENAAASANKDMIVSITSGATDEKFFADANGEVVYKIPVSSAKYVKYVTLGMTTGAQLLLQASTDGENWTTIYEYKYARLTQNLQQNGGLEKGYYTYDLTDAVVGEEGLAGDYVYIRIADSYPSSGWGGNLYYTPVTLEIIRNALPHQVQLPEVNKKADGWNWGASLNASQGSFSVSTTIAAGNAALGNAAINGYYMVTEGVDTTGTDTFTFDFYISNAEAIKNADINLEITSGGQPDKEEANYVSKRLDTLVEGGVKDGWNTVVLPLSQMGDKDKADWTRINCFRLFFMPGVVPGDNDLVVAYDNLRFTGADNKVVVLTDCEPDTNNWHDVSIIEMDGKRVFGKNLKDKFGDYALHMYYQNPEGPMDIAHLKYVEFDIFFTDVDAIKDVVLEIELNSSGDWDKNDLFARKKISEYGFVDGWNHVKIALDTMINENGAFDASALKWFRVFTHAANVAVDEFTFAFTNVRFTDDKAPVIETPKNPDNFGDDPIVPPACTEHVDADKNGKCDNCGADVPVEPGEEETTKEDLYEFQIDNGEKEAPYLDPDYKANWNGSLRFADGAQYFIYKYDLTAFRGVQSITFAGNFGGQYHIWASADGKNWIEIAKRSETNAVSLELDLSELADDVANTMTLYVKIGDSDTSNGNGGNMQGNVQLKVVYDKNADQTRIEPVGPQPEHEKDVFELNSAEEEAHLVAMTGKWNGSKRYADGNAIFTYKYTIKNVYQVTSVIWKAATNQELKLCISFDNENWTNIYSTEENLPILLREYDLTEYLVDENGTIANATFYLRISDTDPSDGWGGGIHNQNPVTLDVEYTPLTDEQKDAIEATVTEHCIPLWGANKTWGDLYETDNENQTAGSGCISINLKGVQGTHAPSKKFDPVNATGMDTFEFEIYLSDLAIVDHLKNNTGSGSVELCSGGACDQGEKSVALNQIFTDFIAGGPVVGWNHVAIPLDRMASTPGTYGAFKIENIDYIRIFWSGMTNPTDQDWIIKLDNFRMTDAQADAVRQQQEFEEKVMDETEALRADIDALKNIAEITAENVTSAKAKLGNVKAAFAALEEKAQTVLTSKGYKKTMNDFQKLIDAYDEAVAELEAHADLIAELEALAAYKEAASITAENVETVKAAIAAAQAKVDALDDDAKALLADYIANIAAAQASVDAYVPPKKSCGGVLTVGAVATMVLAGAWVAIAARKKED